MMLLAALARPDRIVGLVGIATATDFTEALAGTVLSEAQRAQLRDTGYCDLPNCYDDGESYRISRHLLEEGRNHLLLAQESIAIDLPVRLLHGQIDPDVPWQQSLELVERLRSSDVELQLVKDGDHRLSRPVDLHRLQRTIADLLESLQ